MIRLPHLSQLLSHIVVGASAAAIAACSVLHSAPIKDSTQELGGTRWRLTGIGPAAAPRLLQDEVEITLILEPGGNAGGSSGCNSYGGEYEASGGEIRFRNIAGTLMACTDAGVMDLEQAYLNALNSAQRFELTGSLLVIDFAGGKEQLIFEAAAAGG